jgi:hypothetical protein
MIEKEKNSKKRFNTIDVDEKANKYYEPKGKFYNPISSISTNKGFTFGQKLTAYFEKKDDPDFPTFQDDFEKLIEKNKKRNVVKSIGNRLPVYKTDEVGDSSYMMEKQIDFKKRRKRFRKQLFSYFFEDRKDKKHVVLNRKKIILNYQEQKLEEQIKKSYKTDENYLIRDINYNQIESSSPKYTISGKHNYNSIFTQNKNDDSDNNNHKRYATISGKELNDKEYLSILNYKAIYPNYPAFSFGNSKRFDSLSETMNKSLEKNKNKKQLNVRYEDSTYYSDVYKYQDTQSFLMAQTSMGTGEKLKMEKNNNPGPGMYKIKGFADDIAFKGSKINLTRMKIREKEKDYEIDKERRAKLREEWLNEKRAQLKMGIKDYYNSKISEQINNDENNATDNDNN